MKKIEINFQMVSKACNDLVASDVSPSVRKVREYIGGGQNADISRYISKWREQSSLAEKAKGDDISAELRQALLAELVRATESTRTELEKRIKGKNEQVTELQALLEESDNANKELRSRLDEEISRSKQAQLNLEKLLSVSEGKRQAAEQREDSLQRKLSDLQEKFHQAEIAKAVAETRCNDLDARLKEREKKK